MLFIVVKSCRNESLKMYFHLTDQCVWVSVSYCATSVCRNWQASPKELLGCDLRSPATLRVGMHVEFQLGRVLIGWWSLRWTCLQISFDRATYTLNSSWSTENMCNLRFQSWCKLKEATNSTRLSLTSQFFKCIGPLQNDSLLGIPGWH